LENRWTSVGIHVPLIGCVIAAVFFGLVASVERPIMEYYINPQLDTSIDTWIDDFMMASVVNAWVSFAGILTWYVLALFVFRVTNPANANKRIQWLLIGVITIAICGFLGGSQLDRPQDGNVWPYVLFPLNSFLMYYISTLLFSPSSFKYTPYLASYIRRRIRWI
jgi:hypothetical protein